MVLNAEIPLILGMTFFTSVSPEIDWKHSSVSVSRGSVCHKLPVVSLEQKRVNVTVKSWPSVADSNSFGVLEVD